MGSPSLQSLRTAKQPPKKAHSESDGSPVGIPGSLSVDRRIPGSVRGEVHSPAREEEPRMVPENQPLGLKPRLSRELGLAEKRLECYPPCSKWGQPDNTLPRLSAQQQQQGGEQIPCLSQMSVSGLEL